MLHFLAVGSEIRVIAKLAGSLIRAVVIFPAAGRDGARGPELIGEIIEQCGICAGGAGYARSDATASEENVFGVIRGDASGAICFRNGVAGERAPVEFGVRSAAAIAACAARDFRNAEAVTIVDVAIRPAGRC